MDLLLVGIVVFTIISRFIQSYIGKKLNAPDHYYHLIATDEIRKNGHKLPDRNSKFIVFNRFTAYPFLIHIIYSYFRKKAFEKLSRYQSGIFDTIQVIIIFLFARFLLNTYATDLPYYIPYLCAIFYSIYPIFFKIGDSRNITLNARPVGELFSNISLLSLIMYLTTGNLLALSASVIAGSLVFLSSKFGTQAYVFISIFTAALSFRLAFIIIPFISFLLALMLSKGKYLHVINGHITHSYFIYKVRNNPGLDYCSVFRVFGKLFKDPIKTIEELYKFPLFSIILHSPFYIILFYFIFSKHSFIESLSEFSLLGCWALAGFITVILTSFKKTKFLGEADRYGLYAVLPLVILVPFQAFTENPAAFKYIFLTFCILSVIYIFITYKVWSLMPSRKYNAELVQFLETLPYSNCVTNPISLSYEMAYLTKHKILYNPPGFGYSLKNYKKDLAFYSELYFSYPLITKNICELIKKYNLHYLILKKNYAYKSYSNIKDLREEYDLTEFLNVFENKDFVVFKLTK